MQVEEANTRLPARVATVAVLGREVEAMETAVGFERVAAMPVATLTASAVSCLETGKLRMMEVVLAAGVAIVGACCT